MVAFCNQVGMTPLTQEQFAEDERKMLYEYRSRQRPLVKYSNYTQCSSSLI